VIPADVLREVAARGLTISAIGDDLRLQGPRERMDAELVALIRAQKRELIDYLTAPGGFALTDLQRGYLVGRGELVGMGNVASHVYHEIDGWWDLDRLQVALQSVVDRHGMLRTRFTADGRQVEMPTAVARIERLDLRGHTAQAQDDLLAELRDARSHRILPADRAPLLAIEATVLADDRMRLHVSHDGLIMDAISMFLFFRGWWAAYAGDSAPGEGPEAPFEGHVTAVTAARRQKSADRSRRYWLDRLTDLAPHPELPLATNPELIASPRFGAHFARLDAPAWTELCDRAAAAGLTPSVVLLTAYAQTLASWGAGNRFTLNLTVANRLPIHPRSREAIGNFGDTMLVDVEMDPARAFAEQADALQAQLRRDLDHRHISGIEVLRELARRPGEAAAARMPYTFNSAIGYGMEGVDGSAVELFGHEVFSSSQTPQVWLDVTTYEQHGGLVIQFDAVVGLHPDGLVDALAAGYQRLLESLADETGWQAVTFDLLPDDQLQRRRAANETAAERSQPGDLTGAFLAHALEHPEWPAVIGSTGVMTYGELRRRALSVAAWLRERGVGRDQLVGLVMARGMEQLVGILGTVLAGAAYLPVDVGLPAARREYLLADAGVRYVLTNRPDVATGRDVLVLDAAVAAIEGPAADVPDLPDASPDDLAYVLYTSGSTGEPKGVMISRRSVDNTVADCNNRFGITPADRFFGISAFNFDLSVWDVFGALRAGAAVVLSDADRATDSDHWLERCAATGVTVWNSVPAFVALLHEAAADHGVEALGTLRLVMMSGDRIPPALPIALCKLLPGLQTVSLGGPTETTIWNVLHPVKDADDGTRSIPYGRPNENNRAYVLDPDGRQLPDWVVGEICAAGTGLARGYLNDEQRTAERFRTDLVSDERIYRTGDLGRWLPSGELDILGRSDFQIKVNGYRIESGEVETRLAALCGVASAAVVCEDGAHGARLVALLVGMPGEPRPEDATVRERLREQLPEYMIPSRVRWLAALPLNRNGKVDRAALSALIDAEPVAANPGIPLNSDLERDVARLWGEVLRLPVIDATRTLYELGGDSLAAARILATVRKRFGVGITLDRLPEVETVRTMALVIESLRAKKPVAR
jgi:pyochelin synthetase